MQIENYQNPVLEDYEVDGQMDIFSIFPEHKEKERQKIPFELCMNPPEPVEEKEKKAVE